MNEAPSFSANSTKLWRRPPVEISLNPRALRSVRYSSSADRNSPIPSSWPPLREITQRRQVDLGVDLCRVWQPVSQNPATLGPGTCPAEHPRVQSMPEQVRAFAR